MVLRFHRAHFNFFYFGTIPYIPVPGRPLSAYCIDTGIDTGTGTGTGTGYFLVLVTIEVRVHLRFL